MKSFKIILIALLVLAAAGAGAYFFLAQKAEGSDKPEKLSAEEIAEMSIDTDVITTNLGASNFAVVQFNLLLDSKEAKEEAEKRTAEIRAAIISTVSGFTKDELVGEGGIKKLEDALFDELAGSLEKGKVERILVTEFKVQ